MRVLIVGTGAPGGVGRFERLLEQSLARHATEGHLEFRVLHRRSHPAYLNETNADSSRQPMGIAKFTARIVAQVKTFNPEVVLATHVNVARVLPLLGVGHRGRRLMIVAHGVEVWGELDRLRRNALRTSTRIIAVSRYTAAQLVAKHGVPDCKISVVPLALNSSWNISPIPISGTSSPPELLSVSRLDVTEREKGIEDVLSVLPSLEQLVGPVRYRIVGDGDDRPRLEAIARRVPGKSEICFEGLLSHSDLMTAYRRARVFVLPSRKEGFGLVFIEAAAAGCPSVAWAAGGVLEVIEDGVTGRLVTSRPALLDGLAELVADPTKAAAWGLAAHQRVLRNYSFEAFTGRMLSALEAASY